MLKILIVMPVYNEAAIIGSSINTILLFCEENLRDHDWKIVIADNNSTDKTAEIVKKLISEYNGKLAYNFIPQKGKGLAIRESWREANADFYVLTDADLATDLSALPTMIKDLEDGNDLVIGSRFMPGSSAQRPIIRKITSMVFSIVTRLMFGLKIKDYPCGFKGANKNIISAILPSIKNNEFFFDTELVIRSVFGGFKVKEIPIKWLDRDANKSKSRVNVLNVTKEYLRELSKLKKEFNIQETIKKNP